MGNCCGKKEVSEEQIQFEKKKQERLDSIPISQKQLLLFRCYALITIQFIIYWMFIIFFVKCETCAEYTINSTWFYGFTAGISFGFLLLGHLCFCAHKVKTNPQEALDLEGHVKKRNYGASTMNWVTDSLLYFVITMTMALWVGAAAVVHPKVTELFVYSCAWTLIYCVIGLVIYGVFYKWSLAYESEVGAQKPENWETLSFMEKFSIASVQPGFMFLLACTLLTLEYLITSTWTATWPYYGQIAVSVPTCFGLLFWIIFSTYHMSVDYDWCQISSMAVTVEMYVKTMLLVMLVIRICKWIYYKTCGKPPVQENLYDEPAVEPIIPNETTEFVAQPPQLVPSDRSPEIHVQAIRQTNGMLAGETSWGGGTVTVN